MPTTVDTNKRAYSFKETFLCYFRPAALLWVAGFLVCVLLYYGFLLDYHIKTILEFYLSEIHGSKATIGSVDISVTNGMLTVKDLAIEHPSIPERNLYEAQSITGKFLLKPLIRKQLVFERIDVQGVRYLTARQTLESDLPFNPFHPSAPGIERVSAHLYSNLNSEAAKNPLKHLAHLSAGLHTKELISEKLPHLTSARTIDEVQRELAKAEDDIGRALGTTKAGSLSDLQKTKEMIEKVQSTLRLKLGTIETSVQKDAEDIRKGLGLPETDSGSFAPIIFGPSTISLIEQLGQWSDLSRKVMPIRSTYSGKAYVLRQQGRGMTIHFPYHSGFPSLAIMELSIASKDEPTTGTGFVEGTISGITTDPYILGKPTIGNIRFSFPNQGVKDVSIQFEIDHVGDEPKESISIEAGSLTLKNSVVCKISDLSLKIAEGTGYLKGKATIAGATMNATGTFKSDGTRFLVHSPYKKIETYVHSLLLPFYQFELNAKVDGPIDRLTLAINSTIDDKLTYGLNEEIKRQISAVTDTITSNILDQIMPKKHDFLDRLDRLKRIELQGVLNQIETEETLSHEKKTGRLLSPTEPLNAAKDADRAAYVQR